MRSIIDSHGDYTLKQTYHGVLWIVRRDPDNVERAVAFVDNREQWEKFAKAIELGLDEVQAVHAIDREEIPMPTTYIVELIDESDELIGYGVVDFKDGEYTLRPEVHGVRSQAHAAADPIAAALAYYRQNTGPFTRAEMEAAAHKRRDFHTLAELRALEHAGIEVRT